MESNCSESNCGQLLFNEYARANNQAPYCAQDGKAFRDKQKLT